MFFWKCFLACIFLIAHLVDWSAAVCVHFDGCLLHWQGFSAPWPQFRISSRSVKRFAAVEEWCQSVSLVVNLFLFFSSHYDHHHYSTFASSVSLFSNLFFVSSLKPWSFSSCFVWPSTTCLANRQKCHKIQSRWRGRPPPRTHWAECLQAPTSLGCCETPAQDGDVTVHFSWSWEMPTLTVLERLEVTD